MPKSETNALDDARAGLLERKLGSLLNWTPPEIVDTIGPYDPAVFQTYDDDRRQLIAECIDKLKTYNDERIDFLTRSRADDEAGTLKNWRSFKEEEIRVLRRRNPPWYAGGFGHPEHAADFEYWSRMPSLTVEESVCLSIGVEPAEFPPKEFKDLKKSDPSQLWPPLQFLVRRHEQMMRQFDPHSSGHQVRPKSFLAWADRVEFDCHPEFLRLLRRYHLDEPVSENDTSRSKRPDKREIDKIAQLFTAMAIDCLGYRPEQPRSPIPKEIADRAAEMGLQISDDTIRKYLKRGASFLPEGWEPNNS